MNTLDYVRIIDSRKDLSSTDFLKYSIMAATIAYVEEEGGIDKIRKELDDFVNQSIAMPSYKKYIKKQNKLEYGTLI